MSAIRQLQRLGQTNGLSCPKDYWQRQFHPRAESVKAQHGDQTKTHIKKAPATM